MQSDFSFGLPFILKPDGDAAQFALGRQENVLNNNARKLNEEIYVHGGFPGQCLTLLTSWVGCLVIEMFEHHELCTSKPLSCPTGRFAFACHVVKTHVSVDGGDARCRRRAE